MQPSHGEVMSRHGTMAEAEPDALPGRMMAGHHAMARWVDVTLLGVALWLLISPVTMTYGSRALAISDVGSAVLIAAFAALSLWGRKAWAPYAAAAVGTWLLFAPLLFWAPEAGVYLNDTVVGAVVIALAVLIPHGMPMPGPAIPPGWSYNPATWGQRLPIIALALFGFVVSRYMAAYQLGHVGSVWDPFFGSGTVEILDSEVSKMFPVSDAGLGAAIYLLEVLMTAMGDERRWRTMPWMVAFFGLLVVPLGVTSILLVMAQPLAVGTWCTLCLAAAVGMLLMVPLALDEVVAMVQLLGRRRRAGEGVWKTFWLGANEGGQEPVDPAAAPYRAAGGALRGVTTPLPLLGATLIGLWLMAAPAVLGYSGWAAGSDQIVGSVVVTVALVAMAEVARSVRLINALLGMWLLVSPWVLGAPPAVVVADMVAGAALVALSLPRGAIIERYAGLESRVR